LLSVKDGWILVEDTRSRNGTYLNNVVEIVGPTAIGPGDWLRLAGARIAVLHDAGITEADFQQCRSARRLLAYLPGQGGSRKLRLIACAWHRHILGPYQGQVKQLVETAEQLADGLVAPEEMQQARDAAVAEAALLLPGWRWEQMLRLAEPSARAAMDATFEMLLESFEMSDIPLLIHLVRDVLGDVLAPFSPPEEWLRWQGGTLKAMAEVMYKEGTFTDLPILADALEDAGCTEPRVLQHCREPGPHVRGCWVIDALMHNSPEHLRRDLQEPVAGAAGW
jgi:hypothetical protein